jgi:hypothetical protein
LNEGILEILRDSFERAVEMENTMSGIGFISPPSSEGNKEERIQPGTDFEALGKGIGNES